MTLSAQHFQLITDFYTAFARADVENMVACYHPDIVFEDPVFGKLVGEEAKNMWRMLVKPSVQVTFHSVHADDKKGGAYWEARYTYGNPGRPVLNQIHASFEFKEGKIIRHTDEFDLWKWASQALGIKGLLLGWTPYFQHQLQRQARTRLSTFVSKRSF